MLNIRSFSRAINLIQEVTKCDEKAVIQFNFLPVLIILEGFSNFKSLFKHVYLLSSEQWAWSTYGNMTIILSSSIFLPKPLQLTNEHSSKQTCKQTICGFRGSYMLELFLVNNSQAWWLCVAFTSPVTSFWCHCAHWLSDNPCYSGRHCADVQGTNCYSLRNSPSI